MNIVGYAATKEYRDGLASALETAEARRSGSDFRARAMGVRREIARLDKDLSQLCQPLLPVNYVGFGRIAFCAWSSISVPLMAPMIEKESPSIRFNSRGDVSPWNMIRHFDSFPPASSQTGALAPAFT